MGRRELRAMRLTPMCCVLGLSMAILIALTSYASATLSCEHGGPCSCGALYSVDRCAGIGNNSCGCGSGFTGPSLGTTFDCPPGSPGAGGCCLPTGQTFSQACLGRVNGL